MTFSIATAARAALAFALISVGSAAVAQGAPPSKEANGRRKADCSSEAEHANGLQTGRNGQGHQDLGRRLCWCIRT